MGELIIVKSRVDTKILALFITVHIPVFQSFCWSDNYISCYSLLLGIPTGAALDLLSTARENCFTASLGSLREWLSHSPPSTTRVVPLTYFPKSTRTYIILSMNGNTREKTKENERKRRGIFVQASSKISRFSIVYGSINCFLEWSLYVILFLCNWMCPIMSFLKISSTIICMCIERLIRNLKENTQNKM